MKGSTITRHLARLDRHVAELRYAMIGLVVLTTVAQAFAQFGPGARDPSSPWPAVAFWLTLALVLASAFDSVWGIVRVRGRQARSDRDLELEKALVSVLVELSKITGVDVDVPGANVWSIYTRRGQAPSFYREAHRRLSSHPQMSDLAWTKGKGVIGRCWKEDSVKFHDWTPQQLKYATKDQMTDAMWRQVKEPDRWGFDRDEFLPLIKKYQQIIAVPIKDTQGRMIGCLSVDIPADRPAPDSRCLDTAVVRLVLATAAEGLRSLIPSRTV